MRTGPHAADTVDPLILLRDPGPSAGLRVSPTFGSRSRSPFWWIDPIGILDLSKKKQKKLQNKTTKKKNRGRTRSWTEDLLICSQMLYHWAIRPSTNNSRGKGSLLILCEHQIRYLAVFFTFYSFYFFIWKPNRLGVPSYRESHVSGKGVPKSREFNIGMPQRRRQRVPQKWASKEKRDCTRAVTDVGQGKRDKRLTPCYRSCACIWLAKNRKLIC